MTTLPGSTATLDGSGAVGEQTTATMTAPQAEIFSIIGATYLQLPMLDDTSILEARLTSLGVYIAQLRDHLATPGRFSPLMQFNHDRTLARASAMYDERMQPIQAKAMRVADDLTLIRGMMDSFRVQVEAQTKKVEELERRLEMDLTKQADSTTMSSSTNRPSLRVAKSVNSSKSLGEDSVEFKTWLEDFEQVMCELRPYLGELIT